MKKTTFIKLALLITILTSLFSPITNAAYTVDYDAKVQDLQSKQAKAILELDNTFIDNKKTLEKEQYEEVINLNKEYDQDYQNLIEKQNEEIQDKFKDYQNNYSDNITFATFQKSDVYKNLIKKHEEEKNQLNTTLAEDTKTLAEKHDTELNELNKEYDENLAKINSEYGSSINNYTKDQYEEDFAQNVKTKLEEFDQKLEDLKKELNNTTDPEIQNDIIQDIEATKEAKTYFETYSNSIDTYEKYQEAQDMLNKSINDLISFYTQPNNPTTETKNTFTPSLIPKPAYIPGVEITSPNQERKLLTSSIIPRLAIAVIGFSGVIALLVLLWAGVRMLIAWGNDEEYTKAKDQILYAIIGLVISLLSYTIVKAIINFKIEENTNTEISQTL